MALEILTQNANAGFAAEKTTRELTGWLRAFKPGVAVYPEAFKQRQVDEGEVVVADLEGRFDDLGYKMLWHQNGDADGRPDNNCVVTLVKKPLYDSEKPAQEVRLADSRNAMLVTVADPVSDEAVRVAAVHLDDRTKAARRAQTRALLVLQPDAVVGDLNETHQRHLSNLTIIGARLAHILAGFHLLPAEYPTGYDMKETFGRKVGKAVRLDEMVSGDSMKLFVRNGYIDADPHLRPTFPAHNPLVQLDHILAGPGYSTHDTQVLPPLLGMDHLGVMTILKRGRRLQRA